MSSKNKKILSTSINKKTSKLMDTINTSIDIDVRLFHQDIKVTNAHAVALYELKILTKKELTKIQKGLKKIVELNKKNKIKFTRENEDIHMNVESLLHEIIGETANKIHTGRSRNDQVATDTRLWVIEASKNLQKLVKINMQTLLKEIKVNKKKIIPGFTHLQVAQPVTLGHHLLAYFEMFKRDIEQLNFVISSCDENPLGSAALAGSNYNLNLEKINKNLGFSKSKNNSLDAVSDRDFCIYFLQASSLISLHLGKLASELILWSSSFVEMFEVSKNYSTGSSIMPQKRNPDSLELVRAKTNIIRSQSNRLMDVISNLPLTYFKDFQEDKKIIFETYDELEICLKVMNEVIKESKFKISKSIKFCEDRFASATDLADYLVIEKKISFRNSYKIIASIVDYAQSINKNMTSLSLKDFQRFHKDIDKKIYDYVNIEKSIFRKKTKMSTNPDKISKAINKASIYLNKL